MDEQWREIPGFEGKYEASNLGNIRSLTRTVTRRNRWGSLNEFVWEGRVLTPVEHRGYFVTKLGSNGKMWGIHQLVAMAWIGPRPGKMTVNHIDGNKQNNRAENLEYLSNRDNVLHAYRTGLLSNSGESNGKSKLTDETVRQVLELNPFLQPKEISELLGIKRHSVHQIKKGAWAHVPRQIA